MNIQINKASEASVREQLTAQIQLLIATRELKSADLLPSVRALGRRLKIHHNTVSQVYGDLVRDGLLVRRRGAKVAVRALESQDRKATGRDIDDLINDAIILAGKAGYTLHDFRRHVLERFSKELPNRVLVVAAEAAFGDLLRDELAEVLPCRVEKGLIEEVEREPGIAEAAIVVSHLAIMPRLLHALQKTSHLVAIQYNDAGYYATLITQLSRPSLIALVSVSQYVLLSARRVLSPMLGAQHSITEHVVTEGSSLDVGAADLILCDSIVYRGLAAREKKRVFPYRIVSSESVKQIRSFMPLALTPCD